MATAQHQALICLYTQGLSITSLPPPPPPPQKGRWFHVALICILSQRRTTRQGAIVHVSFHVGPFARPCTSASADACSAIRANWALVASQNLATSNAFANENLLYFDASVVEERAFQVSLAASVIPFASA